MFHRIISICAATLALSVSASSLARNETKAGEWGIETDTVTTSLPDATQTAMTARPCLSCKSVNLKVTKDTQYFADSTTVSLGELRKVAQTKHFMMVFYHPATLAVTRIVIHDVKQNDVKTSRPNSGERK